MPKPLPVLQPSKELPPRASYSQVAAAQRCGFRYWLSYMAGIEPVSKSINLTRGTMLHEAYDRYMFTGRKDHAVAYEVVNTLADEAVENGEEPEKIAEVVEQCVTVLDAYLPWCDENDKWKLLLPIEGQEKCETSNYYDLKLPNGQTWPVHYKIDAHIEVDGAHFILENKFRNKLDANGLEHDLQILLYQAFWNAEHPDDRVEGVIYNVVGPQPRKKDGAIAVREHYFRGSIEEKVGLRNAGAMILNLQLQAKSGLWPMNHRKDCNWDCDLVGLCMAVRSGARLPDLVDGSLYRVGQRHLDRREEVLD